ncbi:AAA family ATPase [Streptomyces sp. NPDC029044]|uniref:AAA family ATPase n=1 Tax=Streptomyces sp. NPDC029044 TaxID=3157198 RepID=UPI0033E5DDB4
MREPVISERFSREISQHLVLNYIALVDHPLILGIFGPPGEGKTFQLRTMLTRSGVEIVSINAADLESDRAGLPGKLVVEHYVTAAHRIAAGFPAAIVVDDIDTTLGEWSKNTGTVNHQQVLAQLMHLADHPESIERMGTVRRVPVFVTGNDPAKVYSPLRRPGRMAIMHWSPDEKERRAVISAIFSESVSEEKTADLARLYAHRPIAFFTQLESMVKREVAANVIARSAADLGSVVRESQRYMRYIQTALATSKVSTDSKIDELARKLDASFDAAGLTYLTDIAH